MTKEYDMHNKYQKKETAKSIKRKHNYFIMLMQWRKRKNIL